MTETHTTPDADATNRWWVVGGWMLFAIAILTFNLRPLATEVGPTLPTLRQDLGMDALLAGVLTALPTICFAVFGAVAPGLASRFGAHRVIFVGLLCMVVGSFGRLAAPEAFSFLALSAIGLSGMAVSNVLAPSIVQRHFPNRIGLVTAIYSLAMSIGLALASATVVPLADAVGGWRPAFALIAAPIVIALLPWARALRHDRGHHPSQHQAAISLGAVARTRLGWAMAIFFGFQSAQAYSIFGWLPSIYVDAGLSEARAGLMLGITTALGIPVAFFWPALMSRWSRPYGLLVGIFACGLGGYLGLMLAPARMPWLWAILIALGTSAFPMVLALFGMRARTPAGTAALSGFAQSVGYLIAVVGPLLLGVIKDSTGNWHWSIGLLCAMLLPMLVAGLVAIRSSDIEDELPA